MPRRLTVTCPSDFLAFPAEAINQGIHERFEKQVRLYPRNVALKSRDTAYTYAETNGFANSIAQEIMSVGGRQSGRVAVLLPNTVELILAILGVLKARKAYVPLDRSFPRDRMRAMLEDADPVVLLTDDQHMGLATELAGKEVQIVNMSQVKYCADAPDPQLRCDPMDLAYILYTSGTTGRPKGIAFVHRNLLHTTMCLINELFFSASDRVTWLHSPCFGSSVVDIYCCLMAGATLCPWDVKAQGFTGMTDWLVREKITTFQWIPSAFRQFARAVPDGTVFHDIRIAVMAGEPLTLREVELFRRHFPVGSHLVNQVGTAESYNYHLYRVDHHIPMEDANVPVGYPVSEDRQVLILDEDHQALPAGSVGEIAIKSNYMSVGYWRNEPLTRTKFIRLGGDDTPVYLTGDLGKFEPDGCLMHLGRKDFQLKIRGCRIEVAEVEHALTAVPGIADSAVWVAPNRLGESQLVGYIVPKAPGEFDQQAAEEHLRLRLPDYMVPRHYVTLDALPTLPAGKVDRNALPNPFHEVPSRTETAPIQGGQRELEMVALFEEVLQVEGIALDSDFIKMGGDSLLMAILLHRIYQSYGVEINLDRFLDSPTPARLGQLIGESVANGKASPR